MTSPNIRRSETHLYVLLLSAPVLLTLYRYHGYADGVAATRLVEDDLEAYAGEAAAAHAPWAVG